MENLWSPWRSQYIKSASETLDGGCFLCTAVQANTVLDKENLVVFRSEYCFVILNRYPYNSGHTMVVPNQHVGDFTLVNSDILVDVITTIQKTTSVLQQVYKPHGFNIGANIGRVAGAGVPDHIHFHIVPRWNGDVNFMPILADVKVASESLDDSWTSIRNGFKEMFDLNAK